MQTLSQLFASHRGDVSWWIALLGITAQILALISVPSVLLQRRRSPLSALSWILTLFLLPYVGLFLWWAIGRTHLRRKRRKRRSASSQFTRRMDALRDDLPEVPSPEWELLPIKRLPHDLLLWVFRPSSGNRVELLVDGPAVYPAMEQAIRQARHHVHLLFYTWSPDETGRRFRDLVAEKARQGVQVRLLYDAVGSATTPNRFMRPLSEAGGKVAVFHPTKFFRRLPHFNFRNHRKLVLVDGEVAFVGGLNIADCYAHDWHDLAVELRGPVFDQLQEVFLDDWFDATEENLVDPSYFGRWADPPSPPREDGADCAVVASGPHMEYNIYRDAFFLAITQARRRIWITTPYFIPDIALQTALRTAVYRGVDVKLLVPGRSDAPPVQWAGRSYFPSLLEAGVEIYEYQPEILHAKDVVFDDDVSVVGSANMDIRSFRLNFELSVFVRDTRLTGELAELFQRNLGRSRQIRLADVQQQSYAVQLAQSVANLLSPLL